jgi:hypothetical protein
MASSLSLKRMLSVTALLFAAAACATNNKEIDWHDSDSYRGRVVDAATGEPIEGAIVIGVWTILRRHYDIFVEGNPDLQIIRLEEQLTDKDGRFQFAALGKYVPPVGWQRDENFFPTLKFFTPGYEPSYRDRFTWEWQPGAPAATRPPAGWERDIALYRYLTKPDISTVRDSSIQRTPQSKMLGPLTNLAFSIEQNVKISGESGIAQRRAIDAQWRAIQMLDQEIRKYEPYYQWGGGIQKELRTQAKERQGKQ